MSLGEKLRLARLEAGLSQRALCADVITRNMLSQLEHDAAQPSLGTLQYLAARLGKPVSFFLEEEAQSSPNRIRMEAARAQFDNHDFAAVLETLKGYQAPDEIFDREMALLNALSRLSLAERMLDRRPYAREILLDTDTKGLYCEQALERRRLLLLAKLGDARLPSLDEELRIRAEAALKAGEFTKAGHLLDAADDHAAPSWQLLRGRAALALKDYEAAVGYLQKAEAVFPGECAQALEICYRELGDFRLAYEYACKQKRI